jgi:hypothetical protein
MGSRQSEQMKFLHLLINVNNIKIRWNNFVFNSINLNKILKIKIHQSKYLKISINSSNLKFIIILFFSKIITPSAFDNYFFCLIYAVIGVFFSYLIIFISQIIMINFMLIFLPMISKLNLLCHLLLMLIHFLLNLI